MSGEEQTAAIGNLVTDYVATKREQGAIESELSRIGEKLELIAGYLKEPKGCEPVGLAEWPVILDGPKLLAMLKDYRHIGERKSQMESRLKAVGLELP